MLSEYPCNSCGLCCKNLDHIEELKEYDRGDGVCIHLKNDLCSIYEERPLICRIDKMYDKVFYKQFSKKDYYIENLKACQKLQVESGHSENDQFDLKKILEELN